MRVIYGVDNARFIPNIFSVEGILNGKTVIPPLFLLKLFLYISNIKTENVSNRNFFFFWSIKNQTNWNFVIHFIYIYIYYTLLTNIQLSKFQLFLFAIHHPFNFPFIIQMINKGKIGAWNISLMNNDRIKIFKEKEKERRETILKNVATENI